jgi:hypothetical protein
VPGFNINNNQTTQPSAKIEVARQHRWKFATLDPLKDILIYAHKSGRPKVTIDKATLHHQQDCVYFPGKEKWSPIDISFYQSIDNDVAGTIRKWWSVNVVNIATSVINLTKYTCTLEMLNGRGAAVYRYTMYGCWPSQITPDELDYVSTRISEVTFTLEMDKSTEEAVAVT